MRVEGKVTNGLAEHIVYSDQDITCSVRYRHQGVDRVVDLTVDHNGLATLSTRNVFASVGTKLYRGKMTAEGVKKID